MSKIIYPEESSGSPTEVDREELYEYNSVGEVRFYEDSTFLTKDSTAPYSMFVSNLTEGSYVFSAAALLSTGELETSDGVHVTVLSTHQHAPVPLGAALLGNAIALSLPTEPGQQWRIEYTDQAIVGPWTSLTNFVGDGTVITVTDTIQNQKHRFYRAVLTE